jgi:hypothetical protein
MRSQAAIDPQIRSRKGEIPALGLIEIAPCISYIRFDRMFNYLPSHTFDMLARDEI